MKMGLKFSNLPAIANCMMKKFIRDFLFLSKKRAIKTAELPRTMSTNRIHSTASCSFCKNKKKGIKIKMKHSLCIIFGKSH